MSEVLCICVYWWRCALDLSDCDKMGYLISGGRSLTGGGQYRWLEAMEGVTVLAVGVVTFGSVGVTLLAPNQPISVVGID